MEKNDISDIDDKELRTVNIMLLGKSKVGKSFISNRLQGKELPNFYDATICNNYKFVLEEGTLSDLRSENINNQYCFNIIDTGDYKLMNEFSNIKEVNYFVFVYALDDLDSFNCIKTIIDKVNSKGVILNHSNSLMVGNKSDIISERRQIKKLDYLNTMEKWGIDCKNEEMSADLGEDVDKIIEWVIEQEIEKYKPKPEKNTEFCKCC